MDTQVCRIEFHPPYYTTAYDEWIVVENRRGKDGKVCSSVNHRFTELLDAEGFYRAERTGEGVTNETR